MLSKFRHLLTRKRSFQLLLLAVPFMLLSAPCLWSSGLSDAALAEIRDGFEERQADALLQQMRTPFPGYSQTSGGEYIWNRVNFALAILYTYKDDPSPPQNFINAANQAIVEVCTNTIANGLNGILATDGGLHWQANHFVRLHELFGSDSPFYPGLLTTEAEGLIRELLWSWASNKAFLTDADLSFNNSWRIRESENHSAMMDHLCWGAAKILRRFEPYKDMTYSDGSTAEEQYHAWTTFLIEYLRERGKRGLFVEFHSNTYTKYTSQNFYNYYDLAENETLRELAQSVLDLFWADAALTTLDDVTGGAAARQGRPTDLNPIRGGFSGLMWYYYGQGQAQNIHPGHMMLMTSSYRIPEVIMDIALDVTGRGNYEYISRKPGLSVVGKENSFAENHRYWVDYENNQILRYSYVTPDFILGTSLLPNYPNARWTAISSQNRFHSALLRNDAADSGFVQIVPQGRATTSNDRGRNEQWSIQKFGTLITQKLRSSASIAEMRVYIPSDGGVTIEETDGVIFVSTDHTFAAVRVAVGGYTWQDANWIELNSQYSPVIVEVARSVDYQDFAAFKTATLNSIPVVTGTAGNQQLAYTGLGGSGEFVFYMDTDQLPTRNGEPYNLSPDFTYKSPYVNASWPASTVTIEKGDRSLTLDFDLDASQSNEWTDTGDWLGWLYYESSQWAWSASLSKHIFLPEQSSPESGGWLFVPRAQ